MSKRKSASTRRERGGGSLTLRGAVWLARWTDKNGRQHSRSTGETDRARAEDKLRLFASEALEDSIEKAKARAVIQYDGRKAEEAAFLAKQKEATPALSLAEGWEAFLNSPNPDDRRKRKPTATASARSLQMLECQYGIFTRWIRDTYGAEAVTEMRQVTPEVARAFCDTIRAAKSATTFNKYVAFLARVWRNVGANSGLDARITENPFDGIDTEEQREHVREPITESQFREILKHVSGEMKTLFLLGYEAGMRMGDAACLDWRDVDLDARRIVYTPRKTESKAGTMATPPIPARLFAALSRTPPADREGYVLPGIADRYLNGRQRRLVEEVQGILAESGIETKGETADGEARARCAVDYGFHSLRHGYISNLANGGTPLDLARKFAGHVSEEMSARYFHVNDESNARAIRRLDGLARRAKGGRGAEIPAGAGTRAERPLDALAAIVARLDAAQLEEAARIIAEARRA